MCIYHSCPECVQARVGDLNESIADFAEELVAQGMLEVHIENGVVVYCDPQEEKDGKD